MGDELALPPLQFFAAISKVTKRNTLGALIKVGSLFETIVHF
jgi:hypothetical protein